MPTEPTISIALWLGTSVGLILGIAGTVIVIRMTKLFADLAKTIQDMKSTALTENPRREK